MFLVIDSSAPDQVNLSLWLNTVWVHGYFLASAPLLVSIDKFLKQQQKTVADLKGVVVVVGRGRFTATRVATTVANTLAWGLKIPVAGVKLDEFSGYDQLAAVGEKKIKTAKQGSIVEPFYGKEPSITLKKR